MAHPHDNTPDAKADGMHLRSTVLQISLYVEETFRTAINDLLRIPEAESVVIHKLTFDRQIQFLKDLKALDKEEKGRLDLFKNIRNKLIHQIEVRTLEKCFEVLKLDPDEFIRTYEVPPKATKELELWHAFDGLVKQIGIILDKVNTYVQEKQQEDGMIKAGSVGYDVLNECFGEVLKAVHEDLTRMIAEGHQFTHEEIAAIPFWIKREVDKMGQDRWKKKAKERFPNWKFDQ